MTQPGAGRTAPTHTARALAALVAALLILLAGCTGPTPKARQGSQTPSSTGQSGTAGIGGSVQARAERAYAQALELMTPTAVELRRPDAESFHRIADGAVLVVFSTRWAPMRTRYRIYALGWRPLTPLLEVRVQLDILRTVNDGFLASVSARKNGLRWNGIAHVAVDGSLRDLQEATSATTPEPGDFLVVRREWTRSDPLVYRPTDSSTSGAAEPYGAPGELFLVEPRHGQKPPRKHSSTYAVSPEFPCYLHYPPEPGTLMQQLDIEVYWSIDGGVTWHRTQLDPGVLPANWPDRVVNCHVRGGAGGGRMVLLTDDGPRNDFSNDGNRGVLYTLALNADSGRARVISALPVSRGEHIIWQSWASTDGRALLLPARQSTQGIWVGTDRSNTSLRLHNMPRLGYGSLIETNGLLVINRPNGTLIHASADGGVTWRVVNLRGDSWLTAPNP